jgi:tetratricopeptide (TPR) repeat protein
MYLVDVSGAYMAFQKSIELDADLLEAEIGLGNAALWLDREPEAIALFESAVRRSSQPGRLLLLNLGTAYQFSGRFDDAQRMFSRVMAEHPYDHSSRWYLCQLDLSLCRWQEGWFNYSSRFAARAATYRPTPFKPWDGSAAPADVLLILADEGIGDEILYASCFADAARLVRHLVIECEPRLEGLFKRSFTEATVIPSRREVDNAWLVDAPKPNWHIPSGNLPGLFRRADSSFPNHTGYLAADPARVEYWRTRLAQDLGPGLKVGISWRGGTVKTRARARTLSPEHFGPILSVPGVHFVSLQYGDYASELASLRAFHGVDIHDYPEAIADYDETAALVVALELVVTVCTAVVHLAGALGKPVWILTPLSPGWRYTANRTSMPWYPSSRIFRQRHYDEWLPVCREVSDELTQLTKIGRPIGQLSST